MSSKDGISPEDDLADSLKDFIDQSTASMAYKNLQDRLRGRKVANRNPVFGNIASCQKANFIAREDGIPGNLTIFAFPRSEFKNIFKEKSTSLSKQKIVILKN
eukprot:577088-Ditylum_brightwellii.AAC.1